MPCRERLIIRSVISTSVDGVARLNTPLRDEMLMGTTSSVQVRANTAVDSNREINSASMIDNCNKKVCVVHRGQYV